MKYLKKDHRGVVDYHKFEFGHEPYGKYWFFIEHLTSFIFERKDWNARYYYMLKLAGLKLVKWERPSDPIIADEYSCDDMPAHAPCPISDKTGKSDPNWWPKNCLIVLQNDYTWGEEWLPK